MKNILGFFIDSIGWFLLIIFLIILVILSQIGNWVINIFKNNHFIRALISLFGGVLFFFIILLFSSKTILPIAIGISVSLFCFIVLSFLEGCNPKNKKREVYL